MKQHDIFADNLKHYIKINNKTQLDIVKALNFSQTTVSEWVNGKKFPRIDKLKILSEYFNISLSDLIEEHPTNAVIFDNEYADKYDKLDPISQEAVKALIDIEYKRLNK